MNPQHTPPQSPTRDETHREGPALSTGAGVALSTSETVSRYGSANAEYIKGYTGIDHESGQALHDGLRSLSRRNTGLAQKAGTAAEIHATSRNNARHIIERSSARVARTDDLSREYGSNHPIADRVHMHADGTVSYSQMKFEGDVDLLIKKIVSKDGEYAKYLDPSHVCEERERRHLHNAQRLEAKAQRAQARGETERAAQHLNNAKALRTRATRNQEIGASQIRVEVPAEQVEIVKRQCRSNAAKHRADAAHHEAQAAVQDSLGHADAAEGLRKEARELIEEAKRNDRLAEQVVDSGLSQEQATLAASQPLRVTVASILGTSHRAGVEGAKFGAVIGSCISLLQSGFAAAQGRRDLATAAADLVVDTGKSAALGYGTAFVGAAVKGSLQQSSREGLRSLANTNAPTLAISVCLSLGGSVKRYVTGEITEHQLLVEVGEQGSGMLYASMMAAVGQIAIPVPGVGAAVGGMIGYTLSTLFYQSALDAARGAEASRERLERVRAIEAAARTRIVEEQAALDDFLRREIPELKAETDRLFAVMGSMHCEDVDTLAAAINRYGELLGQRLQFQSISQFETFMASDEPLRL